MRKGEELHVGSAKIDEVVFDFSEVQRNHPGMFKDGNEISLLGCFFDGPPSFSSPAYRHIHQDLLPFLR